jgi:hypothetical protein
MRKIGMSRIFGIAFALVACATVAFGADAGPLQVGASRIEVTHLMAPQVTPPSGNFEHERLFVRAIVLDNGISRAALVSAEAGAGASVRESIAELIGSPIENVIVSGTHTHSAGYRPGRRGAHESVPPPPAPEPTTTVEEMILDAVGQAVANLQPARMGFGEGMSYLNVNRDAINPKTRRWTQDSNLDAPSDKTVAVVKFETPDGKPIAIYSNYAMHPVNFFLAGINSADFPGAASRYIEQVYNDEVVAAFTQGASGDQNPLYLRASAAAMYQRGGQEYSGQPLNREEVETQIRDGYRPMVPLGPKDADMLERAVEAQGIILAEEVLRVVHSTPADESEVRIASAETSVTCPGRARTDNPTEREGNPGVYTDGPDVNIQVGMLGIGTVALAPINGEIYTAIGQGLKEKSPMANTVFVTLSNGRANSGYVPTDDAFGRYTFQVLGSRLKPGCAETGIQDAAVSMISDYVNGVD